MKRKAPPKRQKQKKAKLKQTLDSSPVAVNRQTRSDEKPVACAIAGREQGFLTPADARFAELMERSYVGFHIEPARALPDTFHGLFRRSFEQLDAEGYYQYDIVAPAGRPASTYVKRTLVGEPGITYKYLGLRLFAHPWSGEGASDVCRQVCQLNATLAQRTERMLRRHTVPRLAALPGPAQHPGSCQYNLTLINRMDPSCLKHNLKDEPIHGMGPASVSWHCDSGLENFSSIAVYHHTKPPPLPPPPPQQQRQRQKSRPLPAAARGATVPAGDWAVAMRVGSGAHRDDVTPAVKVPTSSGDAYYMLDDFNHHHQHAVIAGQASLRYSSTHRVSQARDSGGGGSTTVHALLRRCAQVEARAKECSAVAGAADGAGGAGGGNSGGSADGGHALHAHTNAKQMRAEQALLDELEFEWVRQFWLQGRLHSELHRWWLGPIAQLTEQWARLERRTAAQLGLLRTAARGARCGGVSTKAFDVLLQALMGRQARREDWAQRARSKAHTRLEPGRRPVQPVPGFDVTPLGACLTPHAQRLAKARAVLERHESSGTGGGGGEAQGRAKGESKGKGKGKAQMKTAGKGDAPRRAEQRTPAGMSNWERMQAQIRGGGGAASNKKKKRRRD
eukprot:g6143.t1